MNMQSIVDFFSQEALGIEVWVYFASLGAILLGFIFKKVVSVIIDRLTRITEKTKLPFDDILLKALAKPASWAMALGGIYVALKISPLPLEPLNFKKFFISLVIASVGLLIIWFGIRLIDGISNWWSIKAAKTETKLDDQLIPIVRRGLKVFTVLMGGILVLQNMGYSVESLLASLGIGGLAFALAAKDGLANLFGSVIIFLDKPFQIGDWIEMKDLEGTVEEVGIRTTRVRTFANSLITVPNSVFTSSSVNNWSRMKKRRIKMTVGITYDTSPKNVDELVVKIRKIIDDDPKILNDFYLVNFDNFGPSSLDIFIYCFTKTTVWAEFLQAKQEFMLEIMKCVNDMGLSFAFPTQTVHIEGLQGEPKALTGQRPR